MKIAVTGGTGFLGKRLVAELANRHEVTVFDRVADEGLGRLGVRFVLGDLLDGGDLDKLFEFKPEVVYHLAAVLDESSPDLFRVNVDGTKLLLEKAGGAGVKRFIFTGPIGVLGTTKAPSKETDPYNPRTPYERSKVEAEKAVVASGVPYTIARITILLGPNAFWRQIFGAAKKQYPILGDGKNYWHLVYVDEAVDALVLMLKPKAENQIYHIAGDDPRTYEETYAAIAKALGTEVPKKHVPVWLAKAACFFYETKCKLLRRKPDVTKMRASVERLVGNRIVDVSKAKAELGFKPAWSLDAAMAETARALKE